MQAAAHTAVAAESVRPSPQQPPKLARLRALALLCGFIAMLVRKPFQHFGFWYWFGLISFFVALVCYAVQLIGFLRSKRS